MEIWFATTNRGKFSEFQLILQKELPQMLLKSLSDLGSYSQPPENGKSFSENALIKAKSLRAMKPSAWIVAEDSGLVVDGLGGLPGIHSARYAGERASDSENVAKLLKMLQIRQVKDRSAHFECAMIALGPQTENWEFTGRMDGQIAANAKGLHGFGYDPVFVPSGQQQTLAELGSGFKNQHSHRAHATKAFIEKLKSIL